MSETQPRVPAFNNVPGEWHCLQCGNRHTDHRAADHAPACPHGCEKRLQPLSWNRYGPELLSRLQGAEGELLLLKMLRDTLATDLNVVCTRAENAEHTLELRTEQWDVREIALTECRQRNAQLSRYVLWLGSLSILGAGGWVAAVIAWMAK